MCGPAPALEHFLPISVCLHHGVEVETVWQGSCHPSTGDPAPAVTGPGSPRVCWFPEPTQGPPADQEWTRNFSLSLQLSLKLKLRWGC